jgi:hypothetical protein
VETEVNQLLMLGSLDKILVGCIKQHRFFGVANIFLFDAILLKYNALRITAIESENASISYTENTDRPS